MFNKSLLCLIFIVIQENLFCQNHFLIELDRKYENVISELQLSSFDYDSVMMQLEEFEQQSGVYFTNPIIPLKELSIIIAHFTSIEKITAIVQVPICYDVNQKNILHQLWLFQLEEKWNPAMLLSDASILDVAIIDFEGDGIQETLQRHYTAIEAHSNKIASSVISLQNFKADTLYKTSHVNTSFLSIQNIDGQDVEIFKKKFIEENYAFIDINKDKKLDLIKSSVTLSVEEFYLESGIKTVSRIENKSHEIYNLKKGRFVIVK